MLGLAATDVVDELVRAVELGEDVVVEEVEAEEDVKAELVEEVVVAEDVGVDGTGAAFAAFVAGEVSDDAPLLLIRSEMIVLLFTSQLLGEVGGDVEVGEAEAELELATELQLPVLRDRSVGSFSLVAAAAWWWWKPSNWWWWALKGLP